MNLWGPALRDEGAVSPGIAADICLKCFWRRPRTLGVCCQAHAFRDVWRPRPLGRWNRGVTRSFPPCARFLHGRFADVVLSILLGVGVGRHWGSFVGPWLDGVPRYADQEWMS